MWNRRTTAPSTTTTVRAFGRRMAGRSPRFCRVPVQSDQDAYPYPGCINDGAIDGVWVLAQEDGSFGVGPNEFDTSWWRNDQGITDLQGCSFDDEYRLNADGSFEIDHQMKHG